MLDKKVVLEESDAWFKRNKEAIEKTKSSVAMEMLLNFCERSIHDIQNKKILEIGCSLGHNFFFFLNKKLGIAGYGIEPSLQAVEYGNERARKEAVSVQLIQGFSYELPFEDGMFDLVYLGFFLYQIERSLLFKSLMEADRVLKHGGICVITDFDTPIPYKRDNIHNPLIYTYKTDYAQMLLPYGYTLVEKRMYSHGGVGFDSEIQERLSTQIHYKEKLDDIYVKI